MEEKPVEIEVRGTKADAIVEWVAKQDGPSKCSRDMVLCDGGRMVATDGRYVAVHEEDYGLAPGIYGIVRNAGKYVYALHDEDVGKYPRWEDAIPEGIENERRMTWDFSKSDNVWMNQVFSSFYRHKVFANLLLIEKLRKTGDEYDVRFGKYDFSCNGGVWMARNGKLTVYAGSWNTEKYDRGEWN